MSILLWSLIGLCLAVLFAILQQLAISRSSNFDAHHIIARSMLQSALRILVCASFLFFAFSSSIYNGIACLTVFMITRWISLFILTHKIKS